MVLRGMLLFGIIWSVLLMPATSNVEGISPEDSTLFRREGLVACKGFMAAKTTVVTRSWSG
jgi:hypothetical protein